MHHYLYKTVEPKTGRFYIGKHSTSNIYDGYQGSGHWVVCALKKGRHLITGVIKFCDSEQEVLNLESKVITQGLLEHPKCMNQTCGGRGTFYHINSNLSDADRKRMAEGAKRVFSNPKPKGIESPNFGRKRPEHSSRMLGESNPFYGKKHSEETRAKLSSARTPEDRARVAKGNTNVRGRKWFNNGEKSFLLTEEQAQASGLNPGRISWSKR